MSKRKNKRKEANNDLKKEEFYKIGEMYKITVRLKTTENELGINCLYPEMRKKVDGLYKVIEELIGIEDYFLEKYEEYGGFPKTQILGLKNYEGELEENLEKLIEKRTNEYEKIKEYDVGEDNIEEYKKGYIKSILETTLGFFLFGCGIGGLLVKPKPTYLIPQIKWVVDFLSNPIVATTLSIISVPLIVFSLRNAYKNRYKYIKSNEAPRKREKLKQALLFKEKMEIA